jgi:hypothetical protein
MLSKQHSYIEYLRKEDILQGQCRPTLVTVHNVDFLLLKNPSALWEIEEESGVDDHILFVVVHI